MSSYIRKRMRGLLRTTFSAPSSELEDGGCVNISSGPGHVRRPASIVTTSSSAEQFPQSDLDSPSSSSILYERVLNGRSGSTRRNDVPEVYAGKTGLDLPIIRLAPIKREVRAAYTGPDGGLTQVQQMRQQPIVRMANLDDELSLSMENDAVDEDGVGVADYGEEEEDPRLVGFEAIDEGGEESESRVIGRAQMVNGFRHHLMDPEPSMHSTLLMTNSCSLEALGFSPSDLLPGMSTDSFNWNNGNEERAYGVSTSLYERHPVTGLHAGTPVADVFAIIARENSAILALADGVNWGEGSRLAARCAIRGAIDHLNHAIESETFDDTAQVFHCLLGAFHTAHALILQEGGALTTLCVAFVAPMKNSRGSALCVCNVGDSLAFVFNRAYGVREVTLASHDVSQMRDMRDAGGALGPVDGRNPQLHNLTCSMTFVDEGDLIFITSDGISDNFDPVVGKFCVIRRPETEEKENTLDGIPAPASARPGGGQRRTSPATNPFHKTRSLPPPPPPPPSTANGRRCNASLPSVGAFERHELMLLRMGDVISNGLNATRQQPNHHPRPNIPASPYEKPTNPEQNQCAEDSSRNAAADKRAANLCRNLVQFAYHLSAAKRKTLEDPELYRTRSHSKTEERLRRRMIRNMIMDMPGKLDHASVVAYRVGAWPDVDAMAEGERLAPKSSADSLPQTPADEGDNVEDALIEGCVIAKSFSFKRDDAATAPTNGDKNTTAVVIGEKFILERRYMRLDIAPELQNSPTTTPAAGHFSPTQIGRSPYEEKTATSSFQPPPSITTDERNKPMQITLRAKPLGRKRHERGSAARHTLGVDVTWFKRLVTGIYPPQTPTNPRCNQRWQNPSARATSVEADGVMDSLEWVTYTSISRHCTIKQCNDYGVFRSGTLSTRTEPRGLGSQSLKILKNILANETESTPAATPQSNNTPLSSRV